MVWEKLGIKSKICTPGKLKTRKGGLGKIGYPGGLKTRKVIQEKVRELNRMTMSHWITLRTTCKLDGSDQFNQLWTRQQIDKISQRHEGYSRMGTPWDYCT